MAEEEESQSIREIVDGICESLCNNIPHIVLRLKALSEKNADPIPQLLKAIDGVAQAGDTLAEVCIDLAQTDYEQYPAIRDDISNSANVLVQGNKTLRDANVSLSQSAGDRAPAYHDVMEAATSISMSCVHVLEVVYGSFFRRAQVVSDDVCVAIRGNSDATQKASIDLSAYIRLVEALVVKANEFADQLDFVGQNDRNVDDAQIFYEHSAQIRGTGQTFLDAAHAYAGDASDSGKHDAAQQAQDEFYSAVKKAAEFTTKSTKDVVKEEEQPAPVPVQVEEEPEDERPPRASLASQIPEIQVPLDYLNLVSQQKFSCDLVDDLVITAKGNYAQAMKEDAAAIIKRHRIITIEAGNLCTCEMAKNAVDQTAEDADAAIRTLIKCAKETLADPENEENKKALQAAASAYKVIVMKYSDDCLLKPDEGRQLTPCQRLRVAVSEGHSGDEILSLLEEAIGEYNYRAERVQDEEMNKDLLDQVHVIDETVRVVAKSGPDSTEDERGAALDAMDAFENMMIAYLLSLVRKALADAAQWISAINAKDNAKLDAGSATVLVSVSEVSTETRDISEQYTGCVEGTQDEFEAAAKRLDDALQEMIKESRAVKSGRVEPEETVPQQKELDAALHHIEELCKRAQYKRVPKKKEVPPPPAPEPKKEEEPVSVVVERKKKEPEKEEKKEEQKEEKKEEKKELEVANKQDSSILYIIIALVILVLIIFKLL